MTQQRVWWVCIAVALYPPYKRCGGSASLSLFTDPTKGVVGLHRCRSLPTLQNLLSGGVQDCRIAENVIMLLAVLGYRVKPAILAFLFCSLGDVD